MSHFPTEPIPYTSPFARPATPPAATPRVHGVWSFDSDPGPFIPRATPREWVNRSDTANVPMAPPYASMMVQPPMPTDNAMPNFPGISMTDYMPPPLLTSMPAPLAAPIELQPPTPTQPPPETEYYGMQHPVGRQAFVSQIYNISNPIPTVQTVEMQGVNLDTAHVHALTQIHNYRERREQEMSQPRDTAYPARPWEPLTRTPGAPAPGGIPAPQELPREFMNYASDMAIYH